MGAPFHQPACRGFGTIAIALSMLLFLLGSIVARGYTAFWLTEVRLEIFFDSEVIDPAGKRDPDQLSRANYGALIGDALEARFPEVDSRTEQRALNDLISRGARFRLADRVTANPDLIGTRQSVWLPVASDADQLFKGIIPRDVPESDRRVSDRQIKWIDELAAAGDLEMHFNALFFTNTDSREPELAGVWGGIVGSFFTMLITLSLAFPLAVAASVYLEEFAPENRWTEMIEVNINNLVAVPSIVFGLLGLAIFLNILGLPRSSPLVGGMVLALMTLPIIIISSRAALKAVPPSIREAGLAVGASPLQVILYHVLPLALPGILTGTIIGMAQALGETAPLLLIGMVAFVMSVPDGFTDQSTVLPVQIYIWSTSPERGFILWEETKDRLDTPGTDLSGGQQQRLCIARAIALNPEVILMDEPCSSLDPRSTARIEELIDELREKYTIVIVTHNMQQAARVSQRTAFFHEGKVIEVGTTSNIFDNPQEDLTQHYMEGRYG